MDDAYIGSIVMFAGNFAPRGWAFCEGQLIAISDNPSLFSILGTTYGGDGVQTFGLPDLRGRVPVGTGTGPGLTPSVRGNKGGVEHVTLSQSEMPSHTHSGSGTVKAHFVPPGTGDQSNPNGCVMSGTGGSNIYTNQEANITMAANGVEVQVESTGGGQGHYNMQPFLGMNYIICVQGLYPPRT